MYRSADFCYDFHSRPKNDIQALALMYFLIVTAPSDAHADAVVDLARDHAARCTLQQRRAASAMVRRRFPRAFR